MQLIKVTVICEYEQGVTAQADFAIRDDLMSNPFSSRLQAARTRVHHLVLAAFTEAYEKLIDPGASS